MSIGGFVAYIDKIGAQMCCGFGDETIEWRRKDLI